jgi:ribonuclease P protein component
LAPKTLASLRTPQEIQQVLKSGRKFTTSHFIYFYMPQAQPPFKLAVAIKRKWDNAVYRNQTRRRIKEWFRLQKNLTGHLLITQKQKFASRAERKTITTEIQTFVQRL